MEKERARKRKMGRKKERGEEKRAPVPVITMWLRV